MAGWAFADSVLHRLAPLWVGARGLEFTWDYILQGLEANANLVLNCSSRFIPNHSLFPHKFNEFSLVSYVLTFSYNFSTHIFQVLSISLAALGSLMWLRKNKPKPLIPIIYTCAVIVATMPSITRCIGLQRTKLHFYLLCLRITPSKYLLSNTMHISTVLCFMCLSMCLQLPETRPGMALPQDSRI